MAKKIINLPFSSVQWLNAWTSLKDYIIDGTFANKFKRHDTKPFVRYYDAANRLYREFPDAAKRDAWIAAYEGGNMTAEIAAYEFTDGFTAPAPYSISIIALQDNQYVLYGTKGTNLTYSFKTLDSNGSELPESIDVYYTFHSTSGTHQASKIYNAGTSVSLDIDEYLHLGTNTITILLRGRSTGTTKTVVVTYYVVQLELTSTFDIAKSILPNTTFSCTYTVIGQAQKDILFYIDGTLAATASVSSLESTATRTQPFNNTDGHWAPGKHTLQIQARTIAGDSMFYSKLLYYEFVITGITQTRILMEYVFPNTQSYFVNSTPGLSGEQYVTKEIKWAYYSSNIQQQTATVTWQLYDTNGNATTLATRIADVVEAETDVAPDPLQFMPTSIGNYQLKALIGNVVIETYTIAVVANSNGIVEATEGLTMKLSGLGRSNSEPAETLSTWTNRGYACTFSNMPFNGNAGYIDNAVVFNNGATGIINNKPFAEEIAVHSNNGNVVEIDFMSFNVDDESAVIFQIGNPANGPALTIYPTKAVLKSRLNKQIVARFKSDERVKLAFITHPNSSSHTSYPCFMMVQNNGVLAPAITYDATDTFTIGKQSETASNVGMINIGDANAKAGIKIYYIRTYNMTINALQELYNYMIDNGDSLVNNSNQSLASMIAKNLIYQTGSSSNIDVDKVEGMVPMVKITGNINPLIATQSKATTYAALEITFPESPELNITCPNAQLSNAGQSTLGLHMSPSMHVKLDKNGNIVYDKDGNPLRNNRWAFRSGNVPEKKFRLQANPMDSSCCHNGAFMRMVNKTYPNVQINNEYVLRTPIQQYVLSGQYSSDMATAHGGSASDYPFPYTINFVPDSRPCVVVWRLNENTPYELLGLYVMMEEKKSNYANGMHSIYNKITADGKLDPFDFYPGNKGQRLWNNSGCRQMENLRNDAYTLFTASTNWDTDSEAREMAYEMIYPDPDDVVADGEDPDDYWEEFGNEVVKPLAATYNNQSAFNAIVFTIFDKWHLAAYYSRVLRNTCSDSLVRNLQWTKYIANGKWIPKWWDVDMQLGLQQSGACDAEPMTDRDTKQTADQTAYVLSGRDSSGNSSWLWDALEDNNEFMAAVSLIDQALYEKEWTYEKMVEMQDNEYVNKWSPALYNIDGTTKYIAPYLNGYDYLTMFQGDRTSHRHWFQRTSYDYWDAKWAVGEFRDKAVYVRAGGANNQNTMYFKAGATSYFGYGQTQNIALSGIHKTKGDSFSMAIQSATPLLGNDPIQIYACNKLEVIDLHEIARYIWSTVQLDKCYDAVTGTLLKKLILGISKVDMANNIINNQDNIAFTGLLTLTRLEYLDIQGLAGVNSIDISKMVNLKYFYSAGSGLTSFNPANGSDFTAVELPNTLSTITANGVNFTNANGNDCVVTWWNKSTQLQLPPTSLCILNLIGMGQDVGTHKLVSKWLQMLRANPTLISNAQITYRNINWVDITIEDLLTLAQIPAGQRDLTGYVKATQPYTTEQMATLMAAFGNNIFTLENSTSGLCCDCNSTTIIVSASGSNVSVDSDGVIEILQGTTAQMKAVGFPLLASGFTYEWHVVIDGEYLNGSDFTPNIPFDHCTLGYLTGLLTTTECSDNDLTYTIYVERSSGGNGTATVRIKKRTYPTNASIALTYSQTSVSQLEGVLQVMSRGHYLFDATHQRIVDGTSVPFTGRMTEVNGGVWNLLNANSQYVASCASDYLAGHSSFDEFCMQVAALPEEDINMTLQYTSNWRNGASLTATPLSICLSTILNNVVTNSAMTGNVPLFDALEAANITHSDPNSYNSMELKNVTGTLNIGNLITASTLENFVSTGRNVLSFFKNVTTLNIAGCTALTATGNSNNLSEFNPTPMTWLRHLVMTGCTGITQLDLSSMTRLGIDADSFKNCTNLVSITLPATLTSIGNNAFSNTPATLEIVCNANAMLTLNATNGIGDTKASLFVKDNLIATYEANYNSSVMKQIEPISDVTETALMFADGTRIRFADNRTVLL